MWITDTCEWLCDENRDSNPPAPPADDMPPSPQTSVKVLGLDRTKNRNLNKFESIGNRGSQTARACATGLHTAVSQAHHELAYDHALNDSFIEKKEQIYSKMHYDIAIGVPLESKNTVHKSEE